MSTTRDPLCPVALRPIVSVRIWPSLLSLTVKVFPAPSLYLSLCTTVSPRNAL